jgi:micrococcal nuclease
MTWFVVRSSRISLISPIPLIAPKSQTTQNTPIFAKVTKVFDGDTIEIEGGQKVRYIGVDSAEVYPEVQCFSNESLARNKELVLGKIVRLEKDVSETDKYGRLLRFVYVDNIFVNNELTNGGFTKVMTVSPDIKYKDQFLKSENYAKENKLGLWSSCPISSQSP